MTQDVSPSMLAAFYGINTYGAQNWTDEHGVPQKGGTFYGGPPPAVDYSVDEFVATSVDYGVVRVHWQDPRGPWVRMRLLRNPAGPCLDEVDGDLLLSRGRGGAMDYAETGLPTGSWVYYSLFVLGADGVWHRSGDVSLLLAREYNYGAVLYDLLPEIYCTGQDVVLTDDGEENSSLQRFLTIFGRQLDYIRTTLDNLAEINDVATVPATVLPYFANQFGLGYESELGPATMRDLIANAVRLYLYKGSATCLQELSTLVTRWPAVTYIGANLLLDNLDASFDGSVGRWANVFNTVLGYRHGDDIVSAFGDDVISAYAGAGMMTVTTGEGAYGATVDPDGGVVPPVIPPLPPVYPSWAGVQSYVSWAAVEAGYATWYDVLLNTISSVPVDPDDPPIDPDIPTWSGAWAVSFTTPVLSGYTGVPVAANSRYAASAYLRANVDGHGVRLGIDWYDAYNSLIGTTTGLPVYPGVTGEWNARAEVLATSPPNAIFAGLTLTGDDSWPPDAVCYVGAVQLENALDVSEFEPARQVHIALMAEEVNWITNPAGAIDTAGWESDALSSISIDGTGSFALTAVEDESAMLAVTTDRTRVTPGEQWALSFDARDPVGHTARRDALPVFYLYSGAALVGTWRDGVRTPAGDDLTNTGSAYAAAYAEDYTVATGGEQYAARTPLSTDWTRVRAVYEVPDDGSVTDIVAVVAVTNGAADTFDNGEVLQFRHVMLNTEPLNAAYFDGSTPSRTSDFIWEGRPHASRSHHYHRRTIKSYRLRALLPQFLPPSTQVTLHFAVPTELMISPNAAVIDPALAPLVIPPPPPVGHSFTTIYSTRQMLGISRGLFWNDLEGPDPAWGNMTWADVLREQSSWLAVRTAQSSWAALLDRRTVGASRGVTWNTLHN